jgi:hypothetical protein
MPESKPTETQTQTTDAPKSLSPLRCFLGAIVAGAIAYLLYNMTSAIVLVFATKTVQSDNMIIMRMSAAVRTLVIGMAAMGTGIFGMAAIGLTGLGIQILLGKQEDSIK